MLQVPAAGDTTATGDTTAENTTAAGDTTATEDTAGCWATSHGTPLRDGLLAADFAPDGGYVAVGAVGAESTQTSSLGDAWVLDVAGDGQLRSQLARGGDGNDWAAAVKRTPDGGFVVGGSAVVDEVRYPWLAKLDADLEVEWEQLYAAYPSHGQVRAVKPTSDGGYVFAGHGFGIQHDAYVVKTDAAGAPEWSRFLRIEQSAADHPAYDEIWDVREAADGGYVGVGWTFRPSTREDAFVFKLGPDGAEEWSHAYGTLGTDKGRWMAQTADGGYVVAAVTHGDDPDAWVLKLDGAGLLEWQRAYGRSAVDEVFHVHPIRGGRSGYALSGATAAGARGQDGWVFRLDDAGEPLWGVGYGGDADEVLRLPSDGMLAPVDGADFAAWDATPVSRQPVVHVLPGPAVGPAAKHLVDEPALLDVPVLAVSDRQARCP